MTRPMQTAAVPAIAHGIASAPGDLEAPEVEARLAMMRTQFRHDNTLSTLAPRPGEPVDILATSGVGVPVQRASIFYTIDGSPPDATCQEVAMTVADVEWSDRTGYIRQWIGTVPAQPDGTTVRYRIGGWNPDSADPTTPDIWAHDGQGFWLQLPGDRGITTFAFPVEDSAPKMPDWMRDAVIYHVFLDRYHPGNEDGRFPRITTPRARHGGTLRGVHRTLPYLQDLGINCLWLSPIHPSETYHRYDGQDFFGVDPELGTEDDLRLLIGAAHAAGIRIWLDFVPAHCSWHHPAFLAAQRDRSAETHSWFTFNDWPNDYRSFLQVTRSLPSFAVDDPGARAYLIDSAVHWLKDFGVDGFRLDHAIAPSMDFWVAFRAATEAARPDVVNVGEATDTPDCLRRYRGKLHGFLDFELARVLRLAFGLDDRSVLELDNWVSSYERYMADGPGRVSFLDNHDMDRFLWIAGNDTDRLKLAALCQFTLEPTPVVYYGTEIGLTQTVGSNESGFGGDENARGDMPWDEAAWNHDLRAYYQALIRTRRERKILGRGIRRTVHVDVESGTYAYLRSQRPGSVSTEDVLTVFNLGQRDALVHLPAEFDGCALTTLVATSGLPIAAGRTVRLEARSGAALAVGDPTVA